MKKIPSCLLIAAMAASLSALAAEPAEQKPNIIFILSDDQGYGDLGRHGHPTLKTPNLDRMYDQSVRFTNFHVSPTCAPSRAAFMTGKHEFKSGVTYTMGKRSRMSLESVTLAEQLKQAGYATGMFGKWHLGEDGPYRPENRGFDVALTREGVPNRPRMDHWDPRMMLNGEERQYKGFRTDIFFGEATSWIKEQGGQPFFCYIPTYSAHVPHDAPSEFIEPYKDEPSGAKYLAMLANIDHNVGLLLGKLDEWGIAENTIVIYMNDNGGTGIGRYNAGMRGGKATVWRGGTRAMSLWCWPGRFVPGDVNPLTGHVDLMPTLLELAGAPSLTPADIDGLSLVPLLKDHQAEWPKRMLFTHMGRWPDGEADKHKYAFAGVLYGDLHLVRSETCGNPSCQGECRVFQKIIDGTTPVSDRKNDFHYRVLERGHWGLYDLKNDPAERHDLAKEQPEVVQQLTASFEKWWTDVQPNLINE
ncbi:arylsulfatase [Pontiella sulfatireligans]|uniref:Arylsulfatase n=1 Tax=Pontiella sulfatireligans TaxID=2750658 RepID=A0A6C2UGT4_9BACT|nr:arylsulfatase [Pontiella sulfatireligans]SPS74235.1 sulfatase S1_17 [Kiritimatiellales bacterium]VGO18727.1 Arylsulfatase [Pontiella sulfatireligans]